MKSIIKITIKFLSSFRFMNIYIANYLSMYIFFSPAEFSSRCLFFPNTTNMKLKVRVGVWHVTTKWNSSKCNDTRDNVISPQCKLTSHVHPCLYVSGFPRYKIK